MSVLKITEVSKIFAGPTVAVDKFSLEVAEIVRAYDFERDR